MYLSPSQIARPGIGLLGMAGIGASLPGLRGVGLGMWPGDPCYDPNRSSLVPHFIDTPTELACYYGGVAADVYEEVKYGDIPRPEDPSAPKPPTPRVPPTLPVGARTVEEALDPTIDSDAYKRFQKEWADYIASKEADGSYDPTGNKLSTTLCGKPIIQDFSNCWLIGGTVLALLAVVAVKR